MTGCWKLGTGKIQVFFIVNTRTVYFYSFVMGIITGLLVFLFYEALVFLTHFNFEVLAHIPIPVVEGACLSLHPVDGRGRRQGRPDSKQRGFWVRCPDPLHYLLGDDQLYGPIGGCHWPVPFHWGNVGRSWWDLKPSLISGIRSVSGALYCCWDGLFLCRCVQCLDCSTCYGERIDGRI